MDKGKGRQMEGVMAETTTAPEKLESKYITLISSDGFEFVVLRQTAMLSGTIRRMISPGFKEAIDGRCEFQEMNGVILEKVAEYLYYNYKNRDTSNVPDMDIPLEHCLEILMAADYLDV